MVIILLRITLASSASSECVESCHCAYVGSITLLWQIFLVFQWKGMPANTSWWVDLHSGSKTVCSFVCLFVHYLRRRRRLCFRCGLFVCLFVCLSVCQSVRRITRKLVNGFWQNFLEGWGMAQGPSDTILVAIQITLRIRESKVRNPDQRRFVLSEHIFLFVIDPV